MDPWSKGDYSRHIPEAIMVMERPPEGNPPSDRVPGQVLQAIPRSGSRRRNSRSFRVTGLSLGISSMRDKYRPKGDLGGGPSWPRRPGDAASPWPRQAGAWAGGGPPLALLWASGVFRLGYFLGFFHLYLRCTDKNKQKLALGTESLG